MAEPPKVTKSTRAGKQGRVIYCPKCGNGERVYHFSWFASTCGHCWQMIDKLDHYLEPPDKTALPQPLPPVFVETVPGVSWLLRNGDGSETGIAVEFIGKPGDWGPCAVIDGDKTLPMESIAEAKSRAMELLAARTRS